MSSELKTYTQKLVKDLDITDAYSYFVGEEIEFLKKIKHFEDENYFLIVQPVFLFKGYLQNKNLGFLKKINSKNHQILNTLMTINDIRILIAKKLKGIFHITD